jgi:hypothetical protein
MIRSNSRSAPAFSRSSSIIRPVLVFGRRNSIVALGIVVAVSATLLGGCVGKVKVAIGVPSQIVVVADGTTWETYEETLTSIFERTVRIPREEYIFTLRQEELESWDFFRKYKHIILCAALDELTPTATKIRELLSPEAEERVRSQGRGVQVVRNDLYAVGQLLMIITADTGEHLQEYLTANRESLFDSFSQHYSDHLLDLIFRRTERLALEDTLFTNWGFLVRVPYDYRMDASRADDSFVRMIRYNPQRNFFAHWLPTDQIEARGLDWIHELEPLGTSIAAGEDPDPVELRSLGQRAMDFRDEITREFFDRDEIAREVTTASVVRFDGGWAIRLYGAWLNREIVVGGPLVSYCFIDSRTDRLWWLDGTVFGPALQRKEIYLRQMEVIVNTFRSGATATAYLETIPERARGRR